MNRYLRSCSKEVLDSGVCCSEAPRGGFGTNRMSKMTTTSPAHGVTWGIEQIECIANLNISNQIRNQCQRLLFLNPQLQVEQDISVKVI